MVLHLNGDGKNDYLYPLNAWKAINLEFFVYNRYGQVVFRTTNWTNKWDGRINGQLQSTGVFVWATSIHIDRYGRKFFKRGTTVTYQIVVSLQAKHSCTKCNPL